MVEYLLLVQENFYLPADKILFHRKQSAARNVLVENHFFTVKVTYLDAEIPFGDVQSQAEIKIQSQAGVARIAPYPRLKYSAGYVIRLGYEVIEKFLVKILFALSLRRLNELLSHCINGIIFAIVFYVV